MKILLVGATGFLGSAIVRELESDHELVLSSRSDKCHPVDIQDDASVRTLFEKVGQVDAIVSATGHVHFGPLLRMTSEQFNVGLQGKLLGQVRLALDRAALSAARRLDHPDHRHPDRSRHPRWRQRHGGQCGIEGFVGRAAAFELRDARINVVSPNLLVESRDAYGASFPGFEPVPAARAALAFRRSIEGVETGQVYRVW